VSEWTEDDADDFRVILKRPVTEPNVEKTMVKTRVKSSVESRVKSRVKSSVESSVEKHHSVEKNVEKSVEKNVDASVEKVLEVLKKNPYAPQRVIANMLGLSPRGVEEAMRRAKSIGRLKRSGGRKFGKWEVIG
jgi:predicted HTH transcriptional regulator